jgi:hypothetical protein
MVLTIDKEELTQRYESLKFDEIHQKWEQFTSNIDSVIAALGKALEQKKYRELGDMSVSILNLKTNVQQLEVLKNELENRINHKELICGFSRSKIRNYSILACTAGLNGIGAFTTFFVNNTESCNPPPNVSDDTTAEPQASEPSNNAFSRNIGPIIIVAGNALGALHVWLNARKNKEEKLKQKYRELLQNVSILDNAKTMIHLLESKSRRSSEENDQTIDGNAKDICQQIPEQFRQKIPEESFREYLTFSAQQQTEESEDDGYFFKE